MLERLRKIFSEKKKEPISANDDINTIQNSTTSKLALAAAFVLAACVPYYKLENTNNTNQNTHDAAVDARSLDDGSLDGTIDANIQKDSSLDDAALDSSIPDSSTLDAGVDASTQTDAGPTVEDCTNGIDDDGDEMTDCWDPECSSTPACAGEVCMTAGDEESDGAARCLDVECVNVAICNVWNSQCSTQNKKPGEICATGGMGQCAAGKCSQEDQTHSSKCQPDNAACY